MLLPFGVFMCPYDVLKCCLSRQLATFGAAVSLTEVNSVPVCLQEFEDDALSSETHPVNEWTCGPDWQDAPKRETHQFRLVRQLCLVMPQAVWEIGVCVCVYVLSTSLHLPFPVTVFPPESCCQSSIRWPLFITKDVKNEGAVLLSTFGHRRVFLLFESVKYTLSSTETAGYWVSWCAFWKVPQGNTPSEIPLMDLHFIKSLTKIHF